MSREKKRRRSVQFVGLDSCLSDGGAEVVVLCVLRCRCTFQSHGLGINYEVERVWLGLGASVGKHTCFFRYV